MSLDPLVIIGAGGFAREVLDVVNATNESEPMWRFVGFAADDEPDAAILARLKAAWLGTVEDVLTGVEPTHYVVAIGNPATRRVIAERFDAQGWAAATLRHPTATLGGDVEVGAGSVICSHVSITTNVRLGRHVHVNLNSTIGHDCRIGDFVTINPLVAVSGSVALGREATMGTHSTVLQGLRIGAHAFVGAGSVVTKDVESGLTVVGVPARPRA